MNEPISLQNYEKERWRLVVSYDGESDQFDAKVISHLKRLPNLSVPIKNGRSMVFFYNNKKAAEYATDRLAGLINKIPDLDYYIIKDSDYKNKWKGVPGNFSLPKN